ncbi:5265_t:CDS:2 [Entrophospora sp. SA101]|nr:5265_t:CDS:2 [Entrophospora sp. SA101]
MSVKYVTKSEPSHIFNIREGDKYREHVQARRLGSMELMFLLLGKTICDSSNSVEFLTTDPPTMRNKAIKPINYLLNDEESPYWNDHIEKYFARPNHEEFNELTYPSYFEQYNIIKSRPDAKNYPVYVDLLGNYVVKRTTKKLVRFHYLKFQDGEQYFYQQILKNLPCRSEEEILGNYATYKQHFLFLYPEIHNQLQQNTANYIRNQEQLINAKFSEIMENILNNLQDLLCDNISQLLQIQLNSLKISPMINPQNTIIDLPDDQLHVFSIIKNLLGPLNDTKKYPFFFHNCSLLPIRVNDPHLEPLLFPDIFPDGEGYFCDSSGDNRNTDHKMRNYQNTQRLIKQKQIDSKFRLPSAAQLIKQSVYTGLPIIDESITTTIPTFIRTGDSYFHNKELHVNAMINNFGLPNLFITLTMAEGHWTHLHRILAATDNKDTLPTNRPLHTTLFFINYLQELKANVWRKPQHSNWGNIDNFFERVEFQNRGAAHTHGVYWVTKTIEKMITENIIRSDLPDPDIEPELYEYVSRHQIHTCSPKCGGPAAPGQTCKKGFPRPFSPMTHENNELKKYIYYCRSSKDRWVVPYHAPTLIIWNAHINIQYVNTRGLARYLNKYVTKSEPSHIFNIREGDKYREHVQARRLGSMELMFLLLGKTICDSSNSVEFLTTDPPTMRNKAIKPINYLLNDEESPYWNDHIEKYFARPNHEEFNELTYPSYFEQYNIIKSRPDAKNYPVYVDLLGNYVVKRTTKKLVRFHYLKFQDGEQYFYQQILKNLPCRSEEEILGNYATYKQHFLFLYPEIHNQLQQNTANYIRNQEQLINAKFSEIMENILNNLQDLLCDNISQLLQIQLNSLKISPMINPQNTIIDLPDDQLHVFSIIKNLLGPLNDTKKYPFFFITGSAGTGKSYVTRLIKTHNFLLQKFNESHQQKTLEETLNTTYIVGYRETAARFNRMICNMLPVENDKFWICDAIDTIDGKQMDLTDTNAFITDKSMIEEYKRLEEKATIPLQI